MMIFAAPANSTSSALFAEKISEKNNFFKNKKKEQKYLIAVLSALDCSMKETNF